MNASDQDEPTFDVSRLWQRIVNRLRPPTPATAPRPLPPPDSAGAYRLMVRGERGCKALTPGLPFALAQEALWSHVEQALWGGWVLAERCESFCEIVVQLTREDGKHGTRLVEYRVIGGGE